MSLPDAFGRPSGDAVPATAAPASTLPASTLSTSTLPASTLPTSTLPTSTLPLAASGVLRLQHSPVAVPSARRQLRAELVALGIDGGAVDDVEMVVSELMGNSVRHARPVAGGVVLLAWRVAGDEIVVRVTDGGGGRGVVPRHAGPMADSGRGLHIVERLARVWGVSEHAGGLRSVWAALSLEGSPRALRLVT